METNPQKLNAIVIGATGACGRELVDELLNSEYYSIITIPVRRTIDRWEKLTPEQTERLKIIKVENLDFLAEGKEEIEKKLNISGIQFHVVFCCLGSRVGRGKEEFRKVDFTYSVQSCELCEKLNIGHFAIISAGNADKSSWFQYCQVKGEADEEILKKNVNYIAVMHPGIILDRDNDYRTGEAVIKFLPFFPKITSKDIAKAMVMDDLKYQRAEKKQKKAEIVNHQQMEALAKEFKEEQEKKKEEKK